MQARWLANWRLLVTKAHKIMQKVKYQDDFGGFTIKRSQHLCHPLTLGGERLKLKVIALPVVSLLATAPGSWGSCPS
jgi:hypothetical protein